MHDPVAHARRMMVQMQLFARGIHDERVLAAMSEVPRERFLPEAIVDAAYEDRALPIGCDQTISQPYMVAVMTQQLATQPPHRVLEIGTGSGYQAAVLSRLVSRVHTIERFGKLQLRARQILDALGCDNVEYRVGDGTLGWEDAAPFDGIVVTAGAPAPPQALIDQLVDGGRLVIPVGDEVEQSLLTIEKRAGRTIEHAGVACRFVRLVGEQGWHAASD